MYTKDISKETMKRMCGPQYFFSHMTWRHYRQESNLEAFRERVKTCVKASVNQVFDLPTMDDSHYITFTRYVNEVHDPIKREIYEPKVNKYLRITFIIKHIKFKNFLISRLYFIE